MTTYTKGITLTKEELKALGFAIEMQISNITMSGCNTERFKTLMNVKKRIEQCKQGA